MDLTRDLHPDTQAALLAGGFYPVLLVELDWTDGVIRASTGFGNVDWDGHTWVGVAGFGAVQVPEEASASAPAEAVLSMVLPEDEFDTVMGADVQGLPGVIRVALVTEAGGGTLVGAPFELYSGYVDGLVEAFEDVDGRQMHQVRVLLGGGPGMRSGATVVHSHEDQQARYPGDTIGRLLINVRDRLKRVVW